MVKLVIDARMIRSSGIGTYLQNLIPLISSAYDVTLLKNGADIEECTRDFKSIEINSPIYSVKEQFDLPVKIPACDIYWTPHYNVPLLPIKAKKRVVTIHDVFHLAFYDDLNLKQKVYAKLLINLAAKLSDRIITVSDFSKTEILKYTKADYRKITVVHNAIDTETLRKIDNSIPTRAKNRFNLPDKYILFVGNIKPNKNIKRLLRAYEILLKQGFTDYDLVIVGQRKGFITGDSEVFKILEDNSVLKERVFLTGRINNADLPYIYNSSSLLVFPSLYEGFGLPPLEAMACGCPAIVSNAASLPEVCREAAYYVDPYNVEDIASGIYKVLSDAPLRQSLTAKGLERAKLFTWEKSAKKHMKVFDEVLSN